MNTLHIINGQDLIETLIGFTIGYLISKLDRYGK